MKQEKPKHEYPCSECGGCAYIGMSNWKDISGKKPVTVIKKKERLCMRCAKKRNISWSFNNQPKERE